MRLIPPVERNRVPERDYVEHSPGLVRNFDRATLKEAFTGVFDLGPNHLSDAGNGLASCIRQALELSALGIVKPALRASDVEVVDSHFT